MAIDSTVLFIGDQPQYFFDDAVVEVADHLTRTIHHPVPEQRSPLIRRDRPWEHVTYFSCNSWNLRRDPDSGRFHCFYTDFKLDRERLWSRGGSSHGWRTPACASSTPAPRTASTGSSRTWASSARDGRDTNIVFGTEDYGSVYDIFVVDDPLERDPRRRFKTLYTRSCRSARTSRGSPCMPPTRRTASTSPPTPRAGIRPPGPGAGRRHHHGVRSGLPDPPRRHAPPLLSVGSGAGLPATAAARPAGRGRRARVRCRAGSRHAPGQAPHLP